MAGNSAYFGSSLDELFLGWKSANFRSFFVWKYAELNSVLRVENTYADFDSFSWLETSLFLHVFWGRLPLKISSFSGANIFWKSARFLVLKYTENQLDVCGREVSFFSRKSPLKIKIVFWDRNRLKIGPFSGAEIYWKSAHFLGQISIKIHLFFWSKHPMKISSRFQLIMPQKLM